MCLSVCVCDGFRCREMIGCLKVYVILRLNPGVSALCIILDIPNLFWMYISSVTNKQHKHILREYVPYHKEHVATVIKRTNFRFC